MFRVFILILLSRDAIAYIASRKGRSLHINISNIIRGKSDLFVQEEEITLRTQSLSRVMFGT